MDKKNTTAMNIRYIFLDVDGTLTDGRVYYTSSGEEAKAFNIKDGLAIASLPSLDIKVIIITGRKSEIVKKRMNELGVKDVYQGVNEKSKFISAYSIKENIKLNECAYIGDDLNDLSSMKLVGFVGCPYDACSQVREISDYISTFKGGQGAVREIIEYILRKCGKFDSFVSKYDD